MWAFDQASRLRLANSDLCMTAAAAAAPDTAGKLFATAGTIYFCSEKSELGSIS